MFDSLRSWCTFPVIIHSYLSTSGTGDKQYAEPVTYNGYRVDTQQLITDKVGKEYVSKSTVYFPDDVQVTENDLISFPEEPTKQLEIRKLSGWYDGNTGTVSIKVVNL